MSTKETLEGEVRVMFSLTTPHPKVDKETLALAITDALNARFMVRPRESAPYFELHTEVDEADIDIDWVGDRPSEFDKNLTWFVDTKEGESNG